MFHAYMYSLKKTRYLLEMKTYTTAFRVGYSNKSFICIQKRTVVTKGMIYHFIILTFYTILSSNFYTYADYVSRTERRGQELLLCRKCGADVADSNYLFTKVSPGAKKIEKQNIFGKQNVSVQTLVNPFGVNFDIITAEKARCDVIGPGHGAHSWFPGYTWRICACSHCGQHLGWSFKRTDTSTEPTSTDDIHSFSGLILSNILGENYTDSLIVLPKMYKI